MLTCKDVLLTEPCNLHDLFTLALPAINAFMLSWTFHFFEIQGFIISVKIWPCSKSFNLDKKQVPILNDCVMLMHPTIGAYTNEQGCLFCKSKCKAETTNEKKIAKVAELPTFASSNP